MDHFNDPDHELRVAALDKLRLLSARFDDLIPRAALAEGFQFRGSRVPFGSFQNGIYRAAIQEGAAALTILSSFNGPYEDFIDPDLELAYDYREPSKSTARARQDAERDNSALRAAFAQRVPLIWFVARSRGLYQPVAPVFITRDDQIGRKVYLEVGLPVSDTTGAGVLSPPDVRRYATGEAKLRLHQQGFRLKVLDAYRKRCAVCRLREVSLIDAAHILPDSHPDGQAVVTNGLALCRIHHAAYDRNLMGIDPGGQIHLTERLLHDKDGPMLSEGLQAFHGEVISLPRLERDRPSPDRLEIRFTEFQSEAA